MTITTDHPASQFGWPVILDDAGEVLDHAAGFRSARERLGLMRHELAPHLGVSERSIEGWENGRRTIPCEALNMMGILLREKGEL